MILHTDIQGSQAWLDSRRGVITGSRFKDCRDRYADKPEKINKKTGEVTPAVKGGPSTKCLTYAMDTARERVGGSLLASYANGAMRMGTEQEPYARAAYEFATGNFAEEVGFITTDDRRYGVSVDSLVDDDGLIEIKTMVSSATLFTAVIDRDITEYIDQCFGAMWLLGRKWCDLVLWAPDLADIGLSLTIIRIERDDDVIELLEADLMAFEARVTEYEDRLRAKAAVMNFDGVIWDSETSESFQHAEALIAAASAPAPAAPPARSTAPADVPADIFA